MPCALAVYLVAALAVGLSACGDRAGGAGGGSASAGLVGSWTVNLESVVNGAVAHEQAENARRLEAEPVGQRALMEALLPSKERLLEKFRARFASMKAVLVFKADHTFTNDMEMAGEKRETGEGTWELQGEQITVTPRLRNGKPTEGVHAAPMVMTFKNGVLGMQPAPQALPVTFRRM